MKTKTITISLNQATSVMNALHWVSTRWKEEDKTLPANLKVPARCSFLVHRNLQTLIGNPDIIAAEQTRMSLVAKYGVEFDEDGEKGKRVPNDKMMEFSREYTPIGIQPTKLSIMPLTEEVLQYLPSGSPENVAILLPLFDIEDAGMVEEAGEAKPGEVLKADA